MDPNIQLLADSLHKRLDDLDAKWEQRMAESDNRVLESELRVTERVDRLEASHHDRLGRLEVAVQVFDDWRPRVEATV